MHLSRLVRMQAWCSSIHLSVCPKPFGAQNEGWGPQLSSSTLGRVNVLRHQTSKAFCKFGQSSPELEKRSNQERRMVCCCFKGRVRMVWLMPSSTTFLSRFRQHLCIHAKSSTSGCSHVCSNKNRTSFGDSTWQYHSHSFWHENDSSMHLI